MTENDKNLEVIICRQPQDYRRGPISISLIENPHWTRITGGVKIPLGNYYLAGYAPYALVKDIIACSGTHDFGYNNAKIIMCKSHNKGEYKKGYDYLAALAGPNPSLKSSSKNNPYKLKPCTYQILELLESQPLTRRELREQLLAMGYGAIRYQNAVKSLVKQNKIVIEEIRSRAHQKDVISILKV